MPAGFDTYMDVAANAPLPGGEPEPEPCDHEGVDWQGEPPMEFPAIDGRVIEGECRVCGARVLGTERPDGTVENVEAIE